MPAPSWVPVVGGVPVITWLDFRSQQYWNNNAIVANLATILNDVNNAAFVFTPGVGLIPGSPPPGFTLPSAQTSINGAPLIPAPTISPLLDVLNTLDTGGGYTMVIGFIYAGGNGNPFQFELGSPWQNPGTSNFNTLTLGCDGGGGYFPNYGMSIAVEQLTPSFFYNYTTPVIDPFNPTDSVNQQVTIDETIPSLTFSMNGRGPIGPIVMDEAMNAEGAMQFMYLGTEANAVDGIAQQGIRPVGVLQYFALMGKTALPLVNFPAAFLPGGGGATASGGGSGSFPPKTRPPFPKIPPTATGAPWANYPLQEPIAQQEADKWCR